MYGNPDGDYQRQLRPIRDYPIVVPPERMPNASVQEKETRLIVKLWLQKKMEELEEDKGDWGRKDWYP